MHLLVVSTSMRAFKTFPALSITRNLDFVTRHRGFWRIQNVSRSQPIDELNEMVQYSSGSTLFCSAETRELLFVHGHSYTRHNADTTILPKHPVFGLEYSSGSYWSHGITGREPPFSSSCSTRQTSSCPSRALRMWHEGMPRRTHLSLKSRPVKDGGETDFTCSNLEGISFALAFVPTGRHRGLPTVSRLKYVRTICWN